MSQRPSYFLTGDFNNWLPSRSDFQFQEITAPYGLAHRPDLVLTLGSYSLQTALPAGRLRFKIVQDGSWDHQWSVWTRPGGASPADLTEHAFATRHGLKPNLLVYRGDGMPPHAEYDHAGGKLRWDFHPDSQTLTLHSEFERSPGLAVKPWRRFACGLEAELDTFVCLPYGHLPRDSFRYPVCYLFDGRGLFYGEEDSPFHREWNAPARQWPRVLDILARHGVIAPTVIIAVGVPTYLVRKTKEERAGARRAAYLDAGSSLHRALVAAIRNEVIPAAEHDFNLSPSPDARTLLGHSNGGDMALNLLAAHPDQFRGAVAISPAAPARPLSLASLPPNARARLRVALTYSPSEPAPGFLTRTAGVRQRLAEAGIPHLVQLCPEASHDPASAFRYLPAAVGFVMP